MPDYLNEPSADTEARARRSLEIALARVSLSDADRAVLRRMLLRVWPQFCGMLQDERREGTESYLLRTAALVLCVNVFWETVIHTTRPTLIDRQRERMLRQLTEAIREGPNA